MSLKRADFAYNTASQLEAIVRYASATTSNLVAASEFVYDQHGRLGAIFHDGTAPGSTFSEVLDFTYDGAHRISTIESAFDGLLVEYDYDN
ncbi:MAG TPA: hypothetical protein PKC18_00275 [Lacipirellulaceae bacterium]|nr:hypothetical protein [Lacipirellulaceae bacterium]